MPNHDADYSAMSDGDLAQALHDADLDQDTDAILYAENEIIGRLGLEEDETEQGLTHEAYDKIEAFCRANGIGRASP